VGVLLRVYDSGHWRLGWEEKVGAGYLGYDIDSFAGKVWEFAEMLLPRGPMSFLTIREKSLAP